MTGTTRSSADLDPRRRRILVRAWRRGIREMDLVIGGFADAEIADLGDAELDQLEELMAEEDADIFRWVTGEAETPERLRTALFDRMRAYVPDFEPQQNTSQGPASKSMTPNPDHILTGGAPEGFDATLVLRELAVGTGPVCHVARDDKRLAAMARALAFFDPSVPVLRFPGWDCLPYDRVSPGADVSARRLAALSSLAQFPDNPHPAILLVTVNAMLQRVPSRSVVSDLGFSARAGNRLKMEDLSVRLAKNGFERVDTVREVGEYAVRGGILDVFVPGAEEPVRLDFFGDTLESVRHFDPASQRTTTQAKELALNAMSEVTLEPETISRFRSNYLSMFGAANRDDALYVAVSEGRRYPGMEHWLPLFHDEMQTVFDYLGGFRITGDHMLAEAASERRAQIVDHYEARQTAQSIEKGRGVQTTPYKAIRPDLLYLDTTELLERLDALNAVRLTPFLRTGNVGADGDRPSDCERSALGG